MDLEAFWPWLSGRQLSAGEHFVDDDFNVLHPAGPVAPGPIDARAADLRRIPELCAMSRVGHTR
jgi:hypothetical protein